MSSSIQIPHASHIHQKPEQEIPLRNVSIRISDQENIESHQRPTTDADDNVHYPDGGIRAWSIVLGSFFGLTSGFGLINSVGSIQAYITDHQLADLRSPSVASGWIFAVFMGSTYCGSMFSGILFDELGFRIPLIIGSILFTLGILGTANATTVLEFIISFGIIAGLGTAITVNPLVGVISHWFNRKRGSALGFCTLGGSIGGVIFPIMLKYLYEEVGFAWAIRILGFVCLACFGISFTLIRDRMVSNVSQESSTRKPILQYIKNAVEFKAMKSPQFFFCVFGTALSELSLVCTMTYIGSYAISTGVSVSNAYWMITAVNAVGIPGRLIPARLADLYGPYNVTIVMIGVVALSNLAIWLAFGTNEKALWAFIIVYGFFSASVLSLTPVCCASISPTKDFGKRFATQSLFAGITSFSGLPVAGAIIGSGSLTSYNNFIVYTGVIATAGELCWLLARYFIVGWKFNVRV